MTVLIDSFADPAGRLAALTGIIEGPDGWVWFTSPGTDRVGRIDPATGAIDTFTDPGGELRGPANIIPGADGKLWFSCPTTDLVGRIDPAAPDPQATLTTFTAPGLRNPVAIKSAADGRIWVSLRAADSLAAIDPRADDPGSSTLVVTHPAIDLPAAIFPTGDRLWFTNTGSPGIGSLDPTADDPAGTVSVFTPPGEPALRAWAQDRAGRLWISTRNPGGIARFDPADPLGSWRHVTGPDFAAPDGNALGADDGIWAVDSERNALLRIDTESGDTETILDPTIGAPFDLKPGPGRTLWFTNRSTPTIGRVRLG